MRDAAKRRRRADSSSVELSKAMRARDVVASQSLCPCVGSEYAE
jgi:hypothetical protein